ncbi:MAG: RNA-binding protein [Rhodobacteraceae bacterium]|nr:RNA-binding protein [Paracoccaceae bacterium]
MTRGGTGRAEQTDPAATGEGPERRCLVTGERGAKSGLVRFVIGPEGNVVPDILGRLPGRGMWVKPDRALIDAAVRKRAFSRGAKRSVVAPPDLADQVEAGLIRRVIELVALARKAGTAVAGYEKVKAWLTSGDAEVLLQAADGSERGKAKLRSPHGPESLIEVLSASELGVAFGREFVIHGALAGGGLTRRVVEEAARLKGMRAQDVGDRPDGKGTTTI